MTRLAILTALIGVLGCSSDAPPTAPSPVPGPNSGTWTGTASDPVNGSGTLRLDLTELTVDASRSLLGGAWRVEFPGAPGAASGTIAGVRSGATLEITLQPAAPLGCAATPFAGRAGTFWATLAAAGATLAGDYSFQACERTVAGFLSVRRQ